MMKNIPVYKHTAAYAREHDELAAYRASNQANTRNQSPAQLAASRCGHSGRYRLRRERSQTRQRARIAGDG
jgi:hypothetical protein